MRRLAVLCACMCFSTASLAATVKIVCEAEYVRNETANITNPSDNIYSLSIASDEGGTIISETNGLFCDDERISITSDDDLLVFDCSMGSGDEVYKSTFGVDRYTGEYSSYITVPTGETLKYFGRCRRGERIF